MQKQEQRQTFIHLSWFPTPNKQVQASGYRKSLTNLEKPVPGKSKWEDKHHLETCFKMSMCQDQLLQFKQIFKTKLPKH